MLSEQLQAFKQAVIKHTQAKEELSVSLTQETVTYLEFQTRKRNSEKEQLTIGTLVTGRLCQIF